MLLIESIQKCLGMGYGVRAVNEDSGGVDHETIVALDQVAGCCLDWDCVRLRTQRTSRMLYERNCRHLVTKSPREVLSFVSDFVKDL